MVRNVKVTLNWTRYKDPEKVPKGAGIYMIEAGNWQEVIIVLIKTLDIGQSGEGGIRLKGHEREPCWIRNKPTRAELIYSFAPMPSKDYDETDRRIVECCLRARKRPTCGTECNEGYFREDRVHIINIGAKGLLTDEYVCP